VALQALAVAIASAALAQPAPAAPTLVAAGDIACPPGQASTSVTCRQRDTGALAARLAPAVVAPLGDNQYPAGSRAAYARSFGPAWGRLKARIRPAAGNHEYLTAGAAGYFGYFGPSAAPPGGWYSYDLGSWHVVVLNTNCAFVGCGPGSAQETWLRADLASHPVACTLAYFHHPRFTSAGISAPEARYLNTATLAFWTVLHDHGVDVVLNGHAHVYERFAPQDVWARADPGHGIREFTVGSGGINHDRFVRIARNSQVRSGAFGVLDLTLAAGSYRWRFVTAPTGAVRDSGSAPCH
jgi:calcineurin-like phosphoesterase family protein